MSKFVIDNLHSEIEFKVKHLMISTVTGRFTDFTAEITAEKEDFTDAQISFEADVNSITTSVVDRDNHLKSPDFFDADSYPKLSFKSTNVVLEDSTYHVTGLLKIHGVEKEVTLVGEYNGNDTDLYGNKKHGFELTGTIKRSEFGLTFNATTDKGGLLVSDDVKLIASVQFIEVVMA
jgi:polyisoprenoid-binding protein YceI